MTHPYCGHLGFAGISGVLYSEGKYEQALDYANRSFAQRPNAVNVARQAGCLVRLGRHADAIIPLEILVRNRIDEANNLPRLGRCYLEVGRTNDARTLVAQHPELGFYPEFGPLRSPR
ncbi:MAG: hypothetical protein HY043_11665 [Verrucomicrobia bacterium]|nr:hypothetical protein [Verrucomicrobiota bacterium]